MIPATNCALKMNERARELATIICSGESSYDSSLNWVIYYTDFVARRDRHVDTKMKKKSLSCVNTTMATAGHTAGHFHRSLAQTRSMVSGKAAGVVFMAWHEVSRGPWRVCCLHLDEVFLFFLLFIRNSC